jgi:carboxypeptidase C (cathepsin A)
MVAGMEKKYRLGHTESERAPINKRKLL